MCRFPILLMIVIGFGSATYSHAQSPDSEFRTLEDSPSTDPQSKSIVTDGTATNLFYPIEFDQVFVAPPMDKAPNVKTTTSIPSQVDQVGAVQLNALGTVLENEPVASAEEACSNQKMLTSSTCDETHVTNPATHCNECKTKLPCHCQTKPKPIGFCGNWWHKTKLYRWHAKHMGQTGLLCERPFGECNDAFTVAMISEGKIDRAMLHHYDFVQQANGEIQLTQRGHRELIRIANLIADFPVTMTIETTSRPEEDGARKAAVVNAITQLGLPISPDSISLAADRSRGINGVDAQAINAIRVVESVTGASRSRPYGDSSGSTVIPVVTPPGQ